MSSIKPYRLLLIGLLCLVAQSAMAFVVVEEEVEYQERSFDPDRLERYRNDPRFKYERAVPEPPKPKPKERVKRKKSDYTAPRVPSRGFQLGSLGKGIMWVLIIGGGLFLLMQLLRIRIKGLANKKSDEAKIVIEEALDIEDITELELDDPIRNAIEQGQFRKATRLLYLKALRELQERSLIQWRREKTNRQYLRELKRRELKGLFQDITFIFEYIWYGEFQVDKDHFNSAYSSFLQFDQALRRIDEE